MGFQLNNKKGPISEINVTPLVDVMLVLLVIFMISAPLMYSGIKLKLPKTKKVNSLRLTKKQVILSVTPAGEFYVGKDKFLEAELVEVIASKLKQNTTEVLYIRADYDLRYGAVAQLMAKLKKGGIANIALVTEINEKK
jgi:biopolymer transport protein TolR